MSQLLVNFVRKEAGRSLRAVVEYDHTDIEVLHHREGLTEETVVRRTRSIYDQVVRVSGSQEDALTDELGRKRATLQVREDVVIIHLLESQLQGHIISLEPDAARDLTTFLAECLKYVE